jgi:hypothetical protein
MTADDIATDFKRTVSDRIDLRRKGHDRYAVRVPFTFPDGDHFVIILRREPSGNWYLTDEGHTLMHLSYKVNVDSPRRAEHFETILVGAGVENREGRLRAPVIGGGFGDALFAMVQAISQMVETARWTFERARSTFAPEFEAFVRASVPLDRLTPNFTDEKLDPNHLYSIDFRIGNQTDLYVLGIGSDDACRDSTIAIHEHRAWGRKFVTLAVFDDQLSIDAKVLARFTDAQQGRMFSSLRMATGQGRDYIKGFLAHTLPEQSVG